MAQTRKREPIVKEFVAQEEPKTITTKANMFPIEGIPTDYRLYPEGTKIYGRPLNVKEVKLLAGMNETNYTFIINEILQNAISGIDIGELFVADKLYILFWLRANTYKNEGYSTEYICSHCGAKNSYLFTMDKLTVVTLNDKDFDPDKEVKLLTVDDTIKIGFPKVKDENKVNQMLKMNKQLDEDTLSMATMIKTINEEEMSLKYIYEYLNNLSVEDYAFIKSYLEEFDIGISQIIPVTCSNQTCQEENLMEVRFQPEFFLPKYQHRPVA